MGAVIGSHETAEGVEVAAQVFNIENAARAEIAGYD
jgi:hypothetical protein